MAVRTFYGKCDTDAGTSAKVVVIESETITPGFQFNIGDLLVVYFTNTNEVTEPTIVIYNGDTEQEVSTSNGTGKYIKTRSVNVDAVGAWDAGETVIFAYTGNNNEAIDNNAYWELINGAPSTESVYGVTKLDGNIDTNISDWLDEPIGSGDFTKALTPGILKKFYLSLTGNTEPGQGITLGLNWVPAELEEEMTPLGTLSLTSNSEQGVVIEYPIARLIESKIKQVQNTSDLHNDGYAESDYDIDAWAREVEKTIDQDSQQQWDMSNFNVNYLVKVQLRPVGEQEYVDYNNYTFDDTTKVISFNESLAVGSELLVKYVPIGQPKTDGNFYITNILPRNRSLYYYDSNPQGVPYCFLTPYGTGEDAGNLLVNSVGAIKLNGTNGTIVKNGLVVKGNTDESVGPITSGAINCDAVTCGAITASGDIDAVDNAIRTTGGVYGDTIYEGKDGEENPWALRDKYSGKLLSKTITTKGVIEVKVVKNSNSGHRYLPVPVISGYTPIGIVGYNIDYGAKDQGDATWCSLWECHLYEKNNTTNVEFSVRNYRNKDIKIDIRFDILYVRDV